MHGTIVVLASSGSAGGSGISSSNGSSSSSGSSGSNSTNGSTSNSANNGSTSSSGTTASDSTGSGNTLPVTGLDVSLTLLSGAALIGLGLTLRRRGRAGRDW